MEVYTMNMPILPKLRYRVSAIPVKILAGFLEKLITGFQNPCGMQRTRLAKAIWEKNKVEGWQQTDSHFKCSLILLTPHEIQLPTPYTEGHCSPHRPSAEGQAAHVLPLPDHWTPTSIMNPPSSDPHATSSDCPDPYSSF